MNAPMNMRNTLISRVVEELELASVDELAAVAQSCNGQSEKKLDEMLLSAGILTVRQRSLVDALVKQIQDDSEITESTLFQELQQGKAGIAAVSPPAIANGPDRSTSQGEGGTNSGLQKTPVDHDATVTSIRFAEEWRGRFRILRRHAQGGLGVVSVAEDTEIGREVALKEIRPEYSSATQGQQRFLFEGLVTGRLEHPGIVPVYSLGRDHHGLPYYTMRLIRGTSMREAIDDFYRKEKEGSAVAVADFHLWFRKMVGRLVHVCYAIEYAHSCGVVHRDLKPSNIMLGKYGETLVVDWGLAKATDSLPNNDLVGDERLVESSDRIGDETRVGTVVGTAAYMSPEQGEGRLNQMGPWTDVFCLGSTLYAILTGKTPYPGSGTGKRLDAVRAARFDRPRSLNQRVPRSLEAVCLKAMSAARDDRYQSAVALAGDLEQWLADEPVIAYAEPVKDRVGRQIRRHRGAVLTALIALVGLTVGAVVFSAWLGTKNREIFAQNLEIDSRKTQVEAANRKLDESLATARSATMEMINRSENATNIEPSLRSELMQDAYEMYQSIYAQQPDNREISTEFAQVLRMWGNRLRWNGQLGDAIQQYDQAAILLERLSGDDVNQAEPENVLDWIMTLIDRGAAQKSQGDLHESLKSLSEASTLAAGLRRRQPGEIPVIRAEAIANLEKSGIHRTFGQEAEALKLVEQSNAQFSVLANGEAPNENDHLFLIMTYGPWCRALEELGRKSEAAEVYEQGVAQLPEWLEAFPEHNTRFAAARLLLTSAEFLLAEGLDLKKAETQTAQGKQLIQQNCNEIPGQHIYEFLLSEAFRLQAMIAKASGDLETASKNYESARELIAPLVENYVYSTYPLGQARVLRELAILELDANKKGHLLAEATRLCETVLEKTPDDVFAKKRLGEIRELQGKARDND